MARIYVHKIKLKGRDKIYEQFRTTVPKWVINNLKLNHKDEIEFKVSEKTGNVEIHKKV